MLIVRYDLSHYIERFYTYLWSLFWQPPEKLIAIKPNWPLDPLIPYYQRELDESEAQYMYRIELESDLYNINDRDRQQWI